MPVFNEVKMDIVKENIDSLNAVLKVKITPTDYEERVKKALNEYRKKARIPGFRPGMAPMGMVKKMVGNSALVEEINKLLSEHLVHWIKDNDLQILGQPLPKAPEKPIDWDTQSEFEFYFELGLEPAFTIPALENISLKTYTVEVDDQLIDQSVSDAGKRYGKIINPEEAGSEDILYGHFEPCDASGNSLQDGHYHSTILIGMVPDEETKNKLIGMKPEQTVLLEALKTWRDTEDIKARFHVDEEKAKSMHYLSFKLEKISRVMPAEANQELFDKIYGEGVIKSEEEFRARIKSELEKNIAMDADFKLKNDLKEKILSECAFELPNEFLKRWILSNNEKPISLQQLESEYPGYARMLRWQLIENRLVKENNIQVAWEDVKQYTRELLAGQFERMGMPIPDENELNQSVDRVLQNNEETKRLFDNLYELKLFTLFKSKVQTQPEIVSYEEFLKLLNQGA